MVLITLNCRPCGDPFSLKDVMGIYRYRYIYIYTYIHIYFIELFFNIFDIIELLSMEQDIAKRLLHSLSCTKYKVRNVNRSSLKTVSSWVGVMQDRGQEEIAGVRPILRERRFQREEEGSAYCVASIWVCWCWLLLGYVAWFPCRRKKGKERVKVDRRHTIEAAAVRIMKVRNCIISCWY